MKASQPEFSIVFSACSVSSSVCIEVTLLKHSALSYYLCYVAHYDAKHEVEEARKSTNGRVDNFVASRDDTLTLRNDNNNGMLSNGQHSMESHLMF